MDGPQEPIRLAEVLNLTALGVNAEYIKFKNVAMESDKFVSVLEEGTGSVAIVDTVTKKVTKLPAKVDSAIMNPISMVVGFRAGNNLQIYNLEMQTRMKVAAVSENVVFWKWINQNTIAIVTDTSVLHWSMSGEAAPQKVFDRAKYAGAVQILNYKTSVDENWLILGGLAARPTGGVAGVLQLYSVERGVSQPTLDAHAGTFANVQLDGRDSSSTLFCFVTNSPQGPKLSIIEVGAPKEKAFKAMVDVRFQNEQDFALSMHSDDKHGTLFLLTKAGFLYLYEIQSTKCIFAKRISQTTMFLSVPHNESGGIVSLDQSGRLILMALDEANIIPFMINTLKDVETGVRMASRYNLPGADDMFRSQFDKLISSGQIAAAARIAVESPLQILRTPDTISAFKRVPPVQGQPAPLLQYFSLLLQRGKLNAVESIELARPVIASGAPAGKDHLRGWITDGKLEFSEELGDLLRQLDIKLACSVYLRSNSPEKAILCFMQLGEFDKIIAYARSVNYTPDYALLLQQLHRINRDQALAFAQKLNTNETGPLLPINTIVEIFMASQDAKSTTSFLLDYFQLNGDRPEDAELQTKLLEINLMCAPQVADAILDSNQYRLSHFDHQLIAQLSERANLFSRALQYYVDMTDIKRVLIMGLNSGILKPDLIIPYFGRHTPENCVEILREILKFNAVQHLRLVVEVAKTYSNELSPSALIKMFEDFDSQQGLFFYLGSLVNFTENPEIVFKYIEAAVKVNQPKEIERICRDHQFYDPKQVKDFLIGKELPDPRALIQVCDRHNFVDELSRYLYSKNMFPFLEAYAVKMNSAAAPKVIGSLIDLSCDENRIKDLVNQLRPPACPIASLVEEVGKRNRLRLILPWLENRRNEGNTEVALHNGLAKIYVETNNNAKHFLTSNEYYDSKIIGEFCQSRDPHLAFLVYRRAQGACDDELLDVSNKHGFYKDQAKYLVERQEPSLWEKALSNDNEHRRAVIDQVVATALPESRAPEEVSATVKAFMAADLPKELIELLERIVLHGPPDSEFHTNRNLQNLLILTAIKADPSRVTDYLNRMDNYDGPDIARIAISDQYKLYEAAFFIYKKFELGEEAIRVLLDNIDSPERAVEFANYWNKPPVWSILGRSLLESGRTSEAIDAFLKAADPSAYEDVISCASKDGSWKELIVFLKMARSKLRETALDNEMVYALAHTGDLSALEEFLVIPHIAKLEHIGDRLFENEQYEPARIIYAHLNLYAKLALCFLHLEKFQAAVDAARKANSIPTWKAICYACVDAQEFRLAQACGVHIIVYMDHLNDLVQHYETGCYFEQVIALLEQGVNLDRAHQGIFTVLGQIYAKYKAEKLMEHIKLFWSRLNIPSLLGACMSNMHYDEAVFLYSHYDQYDNAVDVLIDHSPNCWKHDLFKQVVVQCTNTEVFYRATAFYLREHPLLVSDLLIEISSKIDHSRIVHLLRQERSQPLALKYLQFIQKDNIVAVNEAVNELFLETSNHKALRESIELYDQFDQIALAQKLETHPLLEMRRISTYLYKINKRYQVAIDIARKDVLYEDVISTAAVSQSTAIAEELLKFFVENHEIACFTAILFSCYSQIRADIVLELGWRYKIIDNVMPFMIQTFREYDDKLQDIVGKMEAQTKAEQDAANEEKKKQEQESSKAAQFIGIPNFGQSQGAPLAIMAPTGYPGSSPMMYPSGPSGPMAPGYSNPMQPPPGFSQGH